MSDSNTAAIDEKKEDTTSTSSGLQNIGKFVTSILSVIIYLLIYFSLSGLVLYGCKIGQSNILPTDNKCYPYSETKPNIDNIPINIFNTFTEPQLSMKINFPYNKINSSNTILDLFRNYKDEPNSNFLANYFISIIESLIQFNFSSINLILNTLNGLPEIIVVLLGPIIFTIASTVVFFLDHFYLIYLWFANMGWFFKYNSNSNSNSKPVWDSVTMLEPFNYACAIGLIILFCILFWFVLLGLPVLPFLTMSLCIFTGLNYMSVMNNKTTYCFTIIKDLLKYYKVTMMYIFSFFVIAGAFANLGTIPGVFSILTVLLIYFNVIHIDLFKAASEDGLTPVVSYEQAKKVCNVTNIKTQTHGFLYNILGLGQKGGESIAKQLKKIGRELNK